MAKNLGDIVSLHLFFYFVSFIHIVHWVLGVADTNNVIGFAIGAMFVREVFHGEAKPQGILHFDNSIRNETQKYIPNFS